MKKAIVLITVISIMIVVILLALVATYLMVQNAYINEHKVRRIKAMYAAQAGIIHALERLRREGTSASTIVDINNDDPNIDGIAVDIEVIPKGTPGCPITIPSDFCVKATVSY